MHKYEDTISELEEKKSELLRENSELNFQLHRKDAEMEALRAELCEEKLKYVNLLERHITMMEKATSINKPAGKQEGGCTECRHIVSRKSNPFGSCEMFEPSTGTPTDACQQEKKNAEREAALKVLGELEERLDNEKDCFYNALQRSRRKDDKKANIIRLQMCKNLSVILDSIKNELIKGGEAY